jgi:hypothetical protein
LSSLCVRISFPCAADARLRVNVDSSLICTKMPQENSRIGFTLPKT